MAEEYEPIISDGNFDMFNKKSEDYKTIVLKCINEILRINTTLLSNSGKITIKIGDQYINKEENTLKVYYQLIDTLEDLLLFTFDDIAIKEINKENDSKNLIFKKYLDLFIIRQLNEARAYQYKSQQIIPKDDPLGKWCWEQIEEETKQSYRRKLRALLLLFKRKNELSGKRIASMGVGTYKIGEDNDD